MPFDLTKKGNKVEVLVEIEEEYYYSFELQFFYTDDTRIDPTFIETIKSFFPSDPSKDKNYEGLQRGSKRVRKLLGYEELIKSGTGKTYKSEWIKHPAIETPVHLTVIKLEKDGTKDEDIVFDEMVTNLENLGGTGSYNFREIDGKHLKKGTYKFTIKSLKDSPEFIGTKVHLWIAKPHGKA